MTWTLILCPWGYLDIKPELADTVLHNLHQIWPMETFINVR
jgi:hypothetical protein